MFDFHIKSSDISEDGIRGVNAECDITGRVEPAHLVFALYTMAHSIAEYTKTDASFVAFMLMRTCEYHKQHPDLFKTEQITVAMPNPQSDKK